jgi:hypothetical protein
LTSGQFELMHADALVFFSLCVQGCGGLWKGKATGLLCLNFGNWVTENVFMQQRQRNTLNCSAAFTGNGETYG